MIAFLEYAFNRDIAARVASKLTSLGLNAEIIVPELTDIPLKERASRINSRCAALGKENVIYISSRAGKEAITNLHVEGIIEYLEANI